MQKVFDNGNLEEINAFIEALSTDATIVLKGNFYGTLKIHHKNNLSLHILGEQASIFGTVKQTIACQKYKQNIYLIQLYPHLELERIWIQDKAFHMACYPNIEENSSALLYCTMDEALDKIKQNKKIDRAFIRGLHEKQWGGNSYKVKVEASGKIRLDWMGNNNRGSKVSKTHVLVENLFSELDAPNEFYYENETGNLFFYSEEEYTSVTLEYSVCQTVMEIFNSSAQVSVQNIGFYRTDNSLYKGKWERYLRSDWAFNPEASVQIQNSQNVSIKDCIFAKLMHTPAHCKSFCPKFRNKQF